MCYILHSPCFLRARPSVRRPGLQSTAPPRLPSCPPTRVGGLSLTRPRSVLPGAVPIEGTAFRKPHTKEDGERVCAQHTHVELSPPLTAHLWASPRENPDREPPCQASRDQTWLLTGISVCTSQQSAACTAERERTVLVLRLLRSSMTKAVLPMFSLAGRPLSHHFTHRSWMEPCSTRSPSGSAYKIPATEQPLHSECMQGTGASPDPAQTSTRLTVRPADTGVTHQDFYPVFIACQQC